QARRTQPGGDRLRVLRGGSVSLNVAAFWKDATSEPLIPLRDLLPRAGEGTACFVGECEDRRLAAVACRESGADQGPEFTVLFCSCPISACACRFVSRLQPAVRGLFLLPLAGEGPGGGCGAFDFAVGFARARFRHPPAVATAGGWWPRSAGGRRPGGAGCAARRPRWSRRRGCDRWRDWAPSSGT